MEPSLTNVDEMRRYVALDKDIDDLEAQAKKLKAEKKELEEQLIAEFERNGMQNMRIDDRTVYLNELVVSRADQEMGGVTALAAVLRAHAPDIVKESVNANSLSSWVRDLQNAGEEIPEEVKKHLVIQSVFSLKIRKAN